MRHNMLVSVAAACLVALATTQAFGAWSQTVDDSDAQFSSWNGDLQTASDGSAVGGSYHYINNWGDSSNLSAIVKYQLSGVPAGNNLYHLYFSSPDNSKFGTPGSIAQWHIFNVAADGTESFPFQNIPWAGASGTNNQYLGPNSGYNPGAFTLLGSGPQNDATLGDGTLIWLNGSGSGQPYIYLKYQGFYTAPIAFDAITVTQVPEPGTIVLSVLGAAGVGLLAWRRRARRA